VHAKPLVKNRTQERVRREIFDLFDLSSGSVTGQVMCLLQPISFCTK
jgi:hypothetical protein